MVYRFTLIIKKITKEPAKKKRTRSKEEEKCMESKRTAKPKEEESIYDQYIIFATSVPVKDVQGKIGELTKQYKNRWQIEIGCRQVESIRPWTTSKNPAYHLLLFLAAMFMHNMWAFLRVSNDVNVKEITLKELVKWTVAYALKNIKDFDDSGGGTKYGCICSCNHK